MIGQSTLLASAFVVPLGMLLLCLAAGAEPDALTAGIRPDTGAGRGAARRLQFFAGDRFGTLPSGLRHGPSRRHAVGRFGAAVDRSGAYASQYLQGRPNHGRFVVCWLMALTGCVGVFLAADMVSFYFLLTLLTLGACGLIIYDETPRAWTAGAI